MTDHRSSKTRWGATLGVQGARRQRCIQPRQRKQPAFAFITTLSCLPSSFTATNSLGCSVVVVAASFIKVLMDDPHPLKRRRAAIAHNASIQCCGLLRSMDRLQGHPPSRVNGNGTAAESWSAISGSRMAPQIGIFNFGQQPSQENSGAMSHAHPGFD